jgi:hypothetical protein
MNGTRHYDVAMIGTGQGGKPLAADGTFIAMGTASSPLTCPPVL